jgi:hypothetical protein
MANLNSNNKRKNNKKNKKKKVPTVETGFYTKAERHSKMSNIMMQIVMEDMNHVLTQEIREGFSKWINEGVDYEHDEELYQYNRTLQIRLYNDKSKETFVCFKYNHVVVEGKVQQPDVIDN